MMRSKTRKIVALVFAAFFAAVSFADTEKVNGVEWTYSIYNGKATIGTGSSSAAIPTSTSGALVIPSTLGGCPVTTIGDYAFWECRSLTSVTIPEGVTTIGDYAFYNCRSLTSVTIPDNVKEIRSYAFCFCSALKSVTIPKGLTTIGFSVFRGCTSLTSVIIHNSVRAIGGSAFRDCSSLATVSIPDSVTTIEKYAFRGCSSLTSIEIPNAVAKIEYGVFDGCSSLTSVTIPDSVETISLDAFYGCSSLATVSIPDSVTEIGSFAFSKCSSLKTVHVDAGDADRVKELMRGKGVDVETITFVESKPIAKPDGGPYKETVGSVEYTFFVSNGEAAIRNEGTSPAVSISTTGALAIPSTLGGCPVTTIGDYAFRECNKITAVTIPASVTTITYRSFYAAEGILNFTIAADNPNYTTNDGVIYTKDLKTLVSCPGGKQSVVVPSGVETIGEGAFNYCGNLSSVALPEGLKVISDWSFAYCPSLKELVIPRGVTTIGASAFSGDNDLASVTILSSVTSVGNEAFWGCSALKTVHVEKGDTARVKELMRGNYLVDVDKINFVEPPSRPAVVDGADESVKAAFDAWISRYGVTDPSAANVNAFVLDLVPTATEEAIQAKVEAELKSLDLGKLTEGDPSAAVAQIQAKYPNAKVELKEVEGFETSAHLYKLVIRLK